MRKKIGVRALRAALQQHSSDQLIEELIQLYQSFPLVQDYFTAKLSPEAEAELLEKYKKLIRQEFMPNAKNDLPSLTLINIKKAINDYKRISDNFEHLLLLMLYFVEQGADFIHTYGDIDEYFYDSMEAQYESACKLAILHGFANDPVWRERFYHLVKTTSDMGYGFGDTLAHFYHRYFHAGGEDTDN